MYLQTTSRVFRREKLSNATILTHINIILSQATNYSILLLLFLWENQQEALVNLYFRGWFVCPV